MRQRLSYRTIGLAALLLVSGSLIWSSKGTESFEERLASLDQTALLNLQPLSAGDQLEGCESVSNKSGWILLVFQTTVLPGSEPLAYFETAPDSEGIFLEYDPTDPDNSVVFRLGLASTPDAILIPLRVVRRFERISFAVGIQSDSVRIISNSIDRRDIFGGRVPQDLKCNAVVLRGDDEPNCTACSITVSYAHGGKPEDLATLLDEVSDSAFFDKMRLTGTFLIWAGVVILLRRHLRYSD